MLLKLNLQRFAPQLGNLQINFDNHIKKVVATSSMWTTSYTWTTSGEIIPGDNTMGASYLQIVTFDVTLDEGYIIDTVTLDTSYESKLETKNDKQFTIKCGSDILGSPITITSKKATSQVSIDLTTLSGWGNVADGQHSIQVVAKADGYRDSEKSTAVNFIKSSGETWVLNEEPDTGNVSKTEINFKSNNTNYVAIEANTMNAGPQSMYYYKDSSTYDVAREYGTWSNESYKTITFETAPTGDLLTWLQANGTKQ